jgi:hypothetical protein
MQPTSSFDWGRAVTPARWIAAILGGAAFLGWAVWTIILLINGSASLDVVQWVVWAAMGVDLVVAILRRGVGELGGGLVLVAGAAAIGVISGFQGPALLAVPLFAVAGALFALCGRYTLAQEERPRAPHATA